jgi:hypothetical protein
MYNVRLDWLKEPDINATKEIASAFGLKSENDGIEVTVVGSKEDIIRFLNRCLGSIDDAIKYFDSHVPSNNIELKASTAQDACVGERTYLVKAASESEAEQKIKNELEKPSRQVKEIRGLISYFETHKLEDFNSLMSRLKEILK